MIGSATADDVGDKMLVNQPFEAGKHYDSRKQKRKVNEEGL